MGERTGGGLKGSERLDKSNPLKARPALCLPMRIRSQIPRARFSEKGPRRGQLPPSKASPEFRGNVLELARSNETSSRGMFP